MTPSRIFASAVVTISAMTLGTATYAAAQLSNDAVTIGVLSDMSGIYKDFEGPGAVVAARMAIEDFGGTMFGKPIKVIQADHQNKPDIASTIARKWMDQEGVDMIVGIDVSSVALGKVCITRPGRPDVRQSSHETDQPREQRL